MDHQDWKPVVLRRNKTKDEMKRDGSLSTVKRTGNPNSHGSSLLGAKAANDFDPENIQKIVTSNQDLGKAIQKARTAKGWKQLELDQKCNLPKNTCQTYENGKAVYNAQHVNKMARILGVTLPRPNKKKSGSK